LKEKINICCEVLLEAGAYNWKSYTFIGKQPSLRPR